MYERFTDNARKVMQLANQQAQRFNHEYIGTEHLLLAILRNQSPGCSTCNILAGSGVDLGRLRMQCEKLIQCGPDIVTMGRLPQTPRAKKVIENAMAEARALESDVVDVQHIFIGLMMEPEGVAYQAFHNVCSNVEFYLEGFRNLFRKTKPTDLGTAFPTVNGGPPPGCGQTEKLYIEKERMAKALADALEALNLLGVSNLDIEDAVCSPFRPVRENADPLMGGAADKPRGEYFKALAQTLIKRAEK